MLELTVISTNTSTKKTIFIIIRTLKNVLMISKIEQFVSLLLKILLHLVIKF